MSTTKGTLGKITDKKDGSTPNTALVVISDGVSLTLKDFTLELTDDSGSYSLFKVPLISVGGTLVMESVSIEGKSALKTSGVTSDDYIAESLIEASSGVLTLTSVTFKNIYCKTSILHDYKGSVTYCCKRL